MRVTATRDREPRGEAGLIPGIGDAMVTWQHEKKKMCICEHTYVHICVYMHIHTYIFNNTCKCVFLKLVFNKLKLNPLKARIFFLFKSVFFRYNLIQ